MAQGREKPREQEGMWGPPLWDSGQALSVLIFWSQRVLGRAEWGSKNPPRQLAPSLGLSGSAPLHLSIPPPSKVTTASSIQEPGLWESLSQEPQADKDVFHSGGVN